MHGIPENADSSSTPPILAYTVYLNGVEEGGETEFPICKCAQN